MATEKQMQDQDDKQGVVKRLLPIIILGVVAALIFSMGWHKYLTLEQLAANREALKAFISDKFFFALLAYIALYIVVVALSLPAASLVTLTGGFLFGWLVGGLATVVAATIGATIIFLIAKTALGEPLAAKAGPWLHKLRDGFQEDALSYLLFLRLVPAFPFWLVNLAPGLLGVKLRTYLLGTFFGIMPGTFAYSYLGVGLDSIIDAQQKSYQACLAEKSSSGGSEPCAFSFDPSALVTRELIFALAALGIVALIPVVIKRFRKTSA